MERKFKVNRLYLSGKGKNKFFDGDIIKASQINNIDEKLADKSIIEVIDEDFEAEEKEAEELKAKELEEAGNSESGKQTETPLFTIDVDGEEVEVYSEADTTKDLIMKELVKNGSQFNPADKKSILFELLLESKK